MMAKKALKKNDKVEDRSKKMAYYSPFIRINEEDKTVEGIASSESVDSYGDIVRVTAIKDALPDYMKFANLRSMHSNIAAGKIVDHKVDETEKIFYITAKVVDNQEWEKVKEEVYKGFSIGGVIEEWEPITVEVADKDGNMHEVFTGGIEIIKIKLIEISLVDRPANPDALISSYKAAKLCKFDSKDGQVDSEENFVPSVILQPDLTRIGKVLDTVNCPSSMKTLKKRNPLSILAPLTMSKVNLAQMQKTADSAIQSALKAAGITDESMSELHTLSRGEIVEAAKELVADVVQHLAILVKADGVEESEEGAVEGSEDETVETEDSDETEVSSEDEETTEDEKETEETESTEEDEKEDEEKEDEDETEETKEASAQTNAIVDAIKSLAGSIEKSNKDTVAEIKKSNKAVAQTIEQFAKKAGGSVQRDDQEIDEDDCGGTCSSGKKTSFKSDPWGKRIA